MTTLHIQFTSIARLSTDKSNSINCDLEIKKVLNLCGLTITKFTLLKEVRDNCEKPSLAYKVVDVECRDQNNMALQKYNLLRQKWSSRGGGHFISSTVELIPWLTFIEKDAFSDKRIPFHQAKSMTNLFLGTLVWPSLLVKHFTFLESQSKGCAVNFYHDVKSVEFILNGYKLEVCYSNIRRVIVRDIGITTNVYLDLVSPPLIFSKIHLSPKKAAWKRIVTYPGLHKHTLGSSSVLAFTLANSTLSWEIISRIHFRCANMPIYCVNMIVVEDQLKKIPIIGIEHFGCLYLITGLLVRSYIISYQYNDMKVFEQEMERFAEADGNSLEKALTDILYALDRGMIFNYGETIKQLFQWYAENSSKGFNENQPYAPEQTRFVRRLTVTPTRILFWPVEVVFENRILRNFNSDYALRVLFRDDNQMKLNNSMYTDDAIYESAIEEITKKGIKVGARRFEFLAWSNSQIRDHTVWFYAKDDRGCTAESIRSWMGDFSSIRSVPKFMARMGQCFSQSVDTISVPMCDRHIRTENDINGGRNPITGEPYCFSDGIGKISLSAAKKVCRKLGLYRVHSAYQIRYAGYKGVLCLDPNLKDVDIVFRESMKKFDCPSINKLEVVQVSLPIPLQLNRPLIAILEHLGVDGCTFLLMQYDMLQKLTDMLLEEDKAMEYLNSKVPHTLINFKDVSSSGISLTTEQFFRSLLLCLHRRAVVKVRSKAQLAIDPSEGRNLLGVLDETGTLRYGQVFVQYTVDILVGKKGGKTNIVQGKVLVTKNPCLQPGDVRLLEAIDVPALHHIVDCVVFPKFGERPHPNEMAGSDLDGDEYAVIWKEDLVSAVKENKPPMHFPSPKPQLTLKEITTDDMINCLVCYIKNDVLGIIGTAHLVMADKKGLDCKECQELAAKFSLAVDFPKSGHPANLSPTERIYAYPDFIEKGNQVETYKSKKILGKLYRASKEFEKVNELASSHYRDVEIDPDLIYPGWEDYSEEALRCRTNYNIHLQTVLQRYGIQHECEAISGAYSQLESQGREKKEKTDIEKLVSCIIQNIWMNTRKEFMKEFVGSTFMENEEPINSSIYEAVLKKASAWYVVTYREKEAHYLSFPWTVSKHLAFLKYLSIVKRHDSILKRPLLVKWDLILKNLQNLQLPGVSDLLVDELVNSYYFVAPRRTIEVALQVIHRWAESKDLVKILNNRQTSSTFVSVDKLIKVFLHAAYLGGFIKKHKDGQSIEPGPFDETFFSPSYLSLLFFKYCISSRFQKEKVNFDFQIPKGLAKCATYAYHSLAATASLDILNLMPNADCQSDHIQVEMEPQRLSTFFMAPNLNEKYMFFIKKCLLKWTDVNDVHIRVTKEKYALISASGTLPSVRMLQRLLSRNPEWLSIAFTFGKLPEPIAPWK